MLNPTNAVPWFTAIIPNADAAGFVESVTLRVDNFKNDLYYMFDWADDLSKGRILGEKVGPGVKGGVDTGEAILVASIFTHVGEMNVREMKSYN